MDGVIFQSVGLLGVAILVALIARRLRLPYTVGLTLAGAALAASRLDVGVPLTHDVIFDLILPPLLFEAALNLHWRELRAEAPLVLTLSTLGVVLCAGVVAGGLVAALGWPLAPALVFGALIAATDPIAVIALLREAKASGRLSLVIESESLLNDGAAAVLFALVLAATQGASAGGATSAASTLGALALIAGGGLAIGVAVGLAAVGVAGRTDDHLVETAVTAVAAWGSFLLAERFGASGVLACVSAGLTMGNLGVLGAQAPRFSLSPRGRDFVLAFWAFAAFVANSLVFLLIGFALAAIPFAEVGVAALTPVIALALAGRAAAVYPLCLAFARSRWATPLAEQHVLWWGGLRGALALALALALPPALPRRDDILVAAFAVVAFSVLAQGLTAPWLLRRLGRGTQGSSPLR